MSILSTISGTAGAVLGALAGGAAAAAAVSLYFTFSVVPAAKEEARVIAEAKAKELTENAIGEVNDLAERARAMRRFCNDSGRVYDFGSNKCRE
jgi:broad specificity polyphosphatase/5'/3'-nucleotidase SurE